MIYYFGGLEMPLFLLTVYAKNEQSDLSKDDLADFVKLVKILRNSK